MKHLKGYVLAISLFYSLTGHSAILKDGGMSAGGGGTVVANPIGERGIESILYNVRQDLYLFFNKVSMYPYPIDPKVDAIKDKIQGVISATKIYASENGCRDKFGEDVDGSIYSPREHSICISLKNLGTKLTNENARLQTSALVAHEYTHVLGYGEEDAVRVQNFVLGGFGDSTHAGKMLEDMTSAAQTLRSDAEEIVSKTNLTWNIACYNADKMQVDIGKFEELGDHDGLSFYDSWFLMGRNSFVVKALALRDGVCRFSDFYSNGDNLKVLYPQAFRGASEVTVEEYVKNGGADMGGPFFNGTTVTKIDNLSQARDQAQDVSAYYGRLIDYIQSLKNLAQAPLK